MSAGSPIDPRTVRTVGRFSRLLRASCNNASARFPLFTSNIPAMLRMFSSGESRALTKARPAEVIPSQYQRARQTYRRNAPNNSRMDRDLWRDRRREIVFLPNSRVVGCRMIKPDRQNLLCNSWIVKFLTAAIRQDHEVELDSYRHDLARPREVGHIDGVHGTTQQNQRPCIETVLSGKHGDATAVAVG